MYLTRTGRGKIARLPREIREQVNRRLADGEPGRNLAKWLNELPAVQAVLAAQFGGQPITETNLTNWRQGGYAQWQAHQEASATLEHSLAKARELEGGNAHSLADRLSLWVMSRLLVANGAEGAEGAREKEWRRLRQLCRDVARLRRNDQGAGWLRLQQERLAGEQIDQEKKLEEEFLKWAKDPAFLETICRRFLDHPDKLALLRQAMFGGLDEPVRAGERVEG